MLLPGVDPWFVVTKRTEAGADESLVLSTLAHRMPVTARRNRQRPSMVEGLKRRGGGEDGGGHCNAEQSRRLPQDQPSTRQTQTVSLSPTRNTEIEKNKTVPPL